MKTYQQLKRLTSKEWENSIDWQAKRLCFLWMLRDYFYNEYSQFYLVDEKEELYVNSVVVEVCRREYSKSTKEYAKYEKYSLLELTKYLIVLNGLKSSYNLEFFKLENHSLYDYITEKRIEEILSSEDEYIQELLKEA